MDRKAYNLYQINPEKEKALWKDAIFIFDSSALLDLYSYPEPTRASFFKEIVEKLKGRVWLPNHVQYEFLKNRSSVIKKSFSEHYIPLREEYMKNVSESFNKTKNLITQLGERISSPTKHPFVDGIDFKEAGDDLIKAIESYKKLEEKLREKIAEREKEILELESNDTVLDRIEKNFSVGEKYGSDEILDIVEEGKLRYEFRIPPGYEDAKEKEGTQIFGDLIIWKQILDYCEQEQKPVVFVTSDIKADWWTIFDKGKKEKAPREELIKEFNDRCGKDFWMYDQAQIAFKAKTYLSSAMSEEDLELISSLFGDFHSNTDMLTYRCNKCKRSDHISRSDLNLDFELVGGSERQMGDENIYKAEGFFKCNSCDHDIHSVFTVYEYPVGVKNYQSIELEGADVIRECELRLNFLSDTNENEIEGIEQILYDYLVDDVPSELLSLSGNTTIEEVHDVKILSINLEKDGTILVKGSGDVSVELNYGGSSDGASMSDYFPFDFEATLSRDDDGYELDDMLLLKVDTSSFYE